MKKLIKKLPGNAELGAARATIDALNAALADGVLCYMYLTACERENAEYVPEGRFTTYRHRVGEVTVTWFSDDANTISVSVPETIDATALRLGLRDKGCVAYKSEVFGTSTVLFFQSRIIIDAFEMRPNFTRTAAALAERLS